MILLTILGTLAMLAFIAFITSWKFLKQDEIVIRVLLGGEPEVLDS